MKKSVCLISLPSPFLIDDKVFPPLGLLYIASALKASGYENVIVHDEAIADIPHGYDLYCISATTPQFPQAVETMKHLRTYRHGKIVIGGPHASCDPESCLDAGFDSVVLQAGETSIQIVDEYGCRLIDTPYKGFLHPDRDLIDLKKYHYEIDGRPSTSMMTSRGCPYQCGFCCKVNKKVGMYPAEFVKEEIELVHDKYGYNAIMFFDDIFTLDKERALSIFTTLKKNNMAWRGLVRADTMLRHGLDFAKTMHDSGCREVGIGVESGSDKILSIVNKGENVDTIKRGIALLKAAGMRVKGFFIVGLPGESWKTIAETQKFLSESGLDDIDLSIFQPYKKSPIYENRNKYDIGWDELDLEKSWYKGIPGTYASQVYTSNLSKGDIVKARDKIEHEFKIWRS
jgi:radical SAM superfamily enzyme YgiQ (UPF0313 family)